MSNGPVHEIENVDGDSGRVRTLCGKYEWSNPGTSNKLISEMPRTHVVTCPECLGATATPSVGDAAVPDARGHVGEKVT